MFNLFAIIHRKPQPEAAPMIQNERFYSVQRLISEKKKLASLEQGDALRFGEVFTLDYMGSSEYEYGAFPAFLRMVHEHLDALDGLQVDIQGMAVFVAYPRSLSTQEHVLAQLEEIASGSLYTRDGARFAPPKVGSGSTRKPRKGSRAERAASVEAYFRVDGWAEISQATFWTTLPMTLERYKELIRASIEYMDALKAGEGPA